MTRSVTPTARATAHHLGGLDEATGELPPSHPITRLRRVAASLAAVAVSSGCPPDIADDCMWFAAGVAAFEDGEQPGDGLGIALGLSVPRGIESWRTTERRLRRNALIRQCRDTHFADLGDALAAAEIRRAILRSRRQRNRVDGSPEAILAEAAVTLQLPEAVETIRQILRLKS